MKPLALLALALLALPARACLNDRDSDSLATQAAQLPETLRVITGRFERNPPLYYQMRIDRERASLQNNPRQFGLYDDIGVALDKLGKSDEALQTMARKRALLPAFKAKDKANREAWYRYFANAGTFRAHRYLNWGAPEAKLDEMETARAEIKRAIEIKPDAHFGRERYQIMAMDWIIARKSGATDKTLGEWMAGRDGWGTTFDDEESRKSKDGVRKRAVKGLSGMVVLGGAWESPDMFEALGKALETEDGVTLRYLAFKRAQELLNDGKKSLAGLTPTSAQISPESGDLYMTGNGVNVRNQPRMNAMFATLRSEADEWDKTRQNWILARMRNGLHPDTASHFWNGYTASEPPSLEMDWHSERAQTNTMIIGGLILIPTLFIGLPIVLWLMVIWRKKRAQSALTES